MPELPEVEVIRRQITPHIAGRTVSTVFIRDNGNIFSLRPAAVKKRLLGRKIEDLVRAGKYLVVNFNTSERLLIHLGMTGQLFVTDPSSSRAGGRAGFQPDIHTHLCLGFKRINKQLVFRDVRKFGKVIVLSPGEVCPRLQRLGQDALVARGEHLFEKTRQRKTAIKNLLLDQCLIAGIGNIYADEALFASNIRPTRKAGTLTRAQCATLVRAAKRIMRRAIASGGSSISDYRKPDGSPGSYQHKHLVYGRPGRPCPRCNRSIERTVVGGRSTHYCPRCQH